MASVKAETLSDIVPEVMMVVMNFRVDDFATVDSYTAASASKSVLAYVFKLLMVVEKFRISSADGAGRPSWLTACQSGRGSKT